MTTKLGTAKSKTVTRETVAAHRGRPIIVRLEYSGRLIRFKEKGRRVWHTATVESCFWLAVRNTAAEVKRLKDEQRKERQRQRKSQK